MSNNHHVTLAVFPFEDLSHQRKLGIFCRSFSDDLITELSRFRQFKVVKYLNAVSNSDSQALSDDLKGGYFVQGSFRGENGTMLVHVQLFDGDKRYLVWGDRLEDKLNALSKMQDKLLRSVVAALQQRIDLDLLSKIRRRPKVAFNAYEHCLYGMDELKKASVEADLKAREHFQKALQIQPDYALACTGMSLSYFNEWTCQLWDRWDVSKTGAYEWAQKAIELDEQNHIITMVLGRIFLYEGSYSTAEYYFKRSLMLNPNDPDTLFPISLYFVYLGLSKEALELYERGLQLHPLFTGNHFRLGGVMYFELGEYERAASFIEHHSIGKQFLDSALQQTLTAVADGDAKERGILLGREAGQAIIDVREGDGSAGNPISPVPPSGDPGVYQAVPPFDFVFAPFWADVRPFGLQSNDQFRSVPHPSLDSYEYAEASNEVKEAGKLVSDVRTADQTAGAHFWYEFSEAGWNRVARIAAGGKNLGLWETARVFALVDMALADAYIAGWDSKFHYNLWRPYTAIRHAGSDTNDQTTEDPMWEPFMPTPPVQDYPSTHSALGNAAATVMESILGEEMPFSMSSPTALPGSGARSFTGFKQAAGENADSRVRAGIHFRFACDAGQEMGNKVGPWIVVIKRKACKLQAF